MHHKNRIENQQIVTLITEFYRHFIRPRTGPHSYLSDEIKLYFDQAITQVYQNRFPKVQGG